MDLQSGKPPYAFRWKDFWFSSDTIIVEMLHWRNKKIIDQVQELITDSEGLFEHLVSRSYSIGGTIVFPVHKNSMNQIRGMNILISDRWDLTKRTSNTLATTALRRNQYLRILVLSSARITVH